MSYQVLARKWRPAKFEQMVGQSHVLMALTNALSQQRLHHAYLFTGTRGVGKTSLARLFAKGLNCETGVTANPCGECSSCIEIAQGRFVDLIEVDAASRTKVDDTRELLDNVQYRPSRGRFKVYLIDEVHMLSRSSFNALLKTLEEPPEHVKFLLATTDPHKLPVTVLSRCLQFNLKSLSQQEICKQLEYVITQEQLPFEPQALNVLAKAANGSMRDALSLTDQAIAFGSGQVMLEQVQTMLGSIDEQHVIALLKTLCDADVAPLMQMVAKVLAFGADAEEVLRSLLELLHQITLTQFAPAAAQQSLFSEQILAFAQQLSPEQVQLYYQMLLNGRKDLAFAPDPKSGLEMALLRAVAFTPEKQVKRWVTTTAAVIDLTQTHEVTDTSPKLKDSVSVSQESLSGAQVASLSTGVAQVNASQVLATQHNTESLKVGSSDAASSEDVTTQSESGDDELDNTVSDQDHAITDAALIAEQSVLLSQAQSYGFNEKSTSQTDAKTDDSLISATGANVSLSIDSAVINATAAKTVDIECNDLADAEPAPINNATESSVVLAVSVDNDLDDTHDSASDTSSDSSFEGYSYSDYEQDGDYQPSDHDDYIAFSAQSESEFKDESFEPTNTLSLSSQEQSVQTSSPKALQQAEEKPAAQTAANQEDALDFLNVVLASRDSLIADVGALQQKEAEAAKTPVVSKSANISKVPAAPKRFATTAESMPETPIESSLDMSQTDTPIELHRVSNTETIQASVPVSATMPEDPTDDVSNGQHSTNESVTADAKYDRAPWIEPAADESYTTFADFAQQQATQPVQSGSAAIQQTSSAFTAPKPAITAEPLAKPSESRTLTAIAPFTQHTIEGDELDLHWYKVMTNVSVGGRVRQLGVNSVCQAQSNPLVLVLKPDQKHLSAPIAIDQLQVALTDYLQQPTEVQIQIGIVPQRETPLELRKRFHRELIAQAEQSILQDDNTQWMIQRLSAQLDSDSIEYPPEQLAQIAQDIAQLTAQ
jgi:DNA polymerase-3 subunit gamma/tau